MRKALGYCCRQLLKHQIVFDVFFLLILSIVPFINYSNVIVPETNIGYNINSQFAFWRETFLWNGNFNFGAPSTYTINFYEFFVTFLGKFHISSSTIEQIWLSFLLFLTALSMYYFIGCFLGRKKRLLKIISSFAYTYSLFLVVTLKSLSTFLIGYMVLPLILGLYINGLRKEKKHLYYAILISLASVIVSNINLTIIAINIIAIFIFLLVYILGHRKSGLLKILKFNILTLIFVLLISSWWMIPIIGNDFLNSKDINKTLSAETPRWYNSHSSYLETFRLLGEVGFHGQYKGIPYTSFSKFYVSNYFLIVSTFLLSVFSICGLFFISSRKKKIYLLLILVLFLPLAVGAYPLASPTITGRIYLWLYNHIPFFAIFRNGYKSVAIISFVYAILLGCFTSSIYLYLKKKLEKTRKSFYKALPVSFVSSIFCLILLNSFPLWTGKLFNDKKFKSVPTYWYKAADYLNSDPLDFRIFVLPDSYFPVYYWGNPMTGDITTSLINKPSIETMGKAWGYKKFTKLFYKNISNKDLFGKILSLSNTKYVLQRNDINWTYYNSDFPKKIKKILSLRDDLRFEKKFGELDLYRADDNYFLPHIYSPKNLSYVASDLNSNSIAQAVSFDNYNLQSGIFFLNSKLDKNSFTLNKINNILIPVGINTTKEEEIQTLIAQTDDIEQKKEYEDNLDLYKNRVVLDGGYLIEIPRKAVYEVYVKKDSLLSDNKDLIIQIGDSTVAKANNFKADREQYWNLFGEIKIEKGRYNFQIYDKDSRISIINPGDIVLRASKLSKPMATPKLEFTKINPTKYKVKVKSANEPFLLVFLESFHPGWKVYAQPVTNNQQPTTDKFISDEIVGAIQNDNLPKGHIWDTWFEKPLPEEDHLMANGYANSWWVDPAEVCNTKGFCHKNPDGSYDFSMVIEFEPQKYFYIGLGISAITLLSCLGYLGYDWRRRRRNYRSYLAEKV